MSERDGRPELNQILAARLAAIVPDNEKAAVATMLENRTAGPDGVVWFPVGLSIGERVALVRLLRRDP